jgi:hypothetical protein
MPASALRGLNLLEQAEPQLVDLQSLDAQLELWTTLAFQSDEPFTPRPLSPNELDKQLDLSSQHLILPHQSESATRLSSDFDMSRFFPNFAIDPFLVPPSDPSVMTPTIPDASLSDDSPLELSSSVLPTPPPAKRARTRKGTLTSTASSEASPQSHTMSSLEEDLSPDAESSKSSLTPVSASEDKRRRNTAASARFRAKKKEREAALERKSKELETRVSELERECEALRRENGWLKGLVVGVTNAGGAPQGTKRRRQEDEFTITDEVKP